MDIFLSINNREQVIQLPIVPEGFQIEQSNNNKVFKGITQGEINLLGLEGLKSISIETFFPNKNYDFSKSNKHTGDEFVEIMGKWIARRIPIRLIIINKNGKEIINIPVSIDAFNWGYDATGDVVYNLGLKEFRFVEVI